MSGGVTAWKFRGPDGQPIELIETSDEAWSGVALRNPGAVFLGVDHTALGCGDIDAGVAFYERLGFRRGPASRNFGPEQDRLDGHSGVDLEIATLFTPAAGPHIELLHYRGPPAPAVSAAPGRIAMRLAGDGQAVPVSQDADGHRIAIEGAAI